MTEMTTSPPDTTDRIALRLLLLEDSANDAELEVTLLEGAGYACEWERVETRADFLARLNAKSYDCILSDYRLPAFNGLAALRMVRDMGLITPFILVSGTLGEDDAIESLKAGATDYVLKTRYQRLVPAVQRALAEHAQARRHRETEAARVEETEIAAALVRVAREVIASLDTPVLLRQMCQLTTELLRCDCSHAFLLRPDGNVDVVMTGHDTGSDGGDTPGIARSAGAFAQLLERLEHDVVVELPADAAPRDLLPAHMECATSGVGVYMALRRATGIVGVLAASRHRAQPFARTHLRMAHGIAQLASLALANARVVQELEDVSRLKSDFVNVISHELRTPLNIILGYGELLSDGTLGALVPDQQQAVHQLRRAAHQLLDMVNTVLDVGLLEARALRIDTDTLDLPDLLAQIETETEAAFHEKPALHLRMAVHRGAEQVQTDGAKLKVVIKKVVDNAIKFTDAGTITVDAHLLDGGVEITVSDTGIGISPEILPVIFLPFRQGERSLTRRHGGIGVGLYLTRRLLEVLGGRITVASTPGQGSTFGIWVPSPDGITVQRARGRAA